MARNRGALGARARRMAGHTSQDSVASQESVEQLRERAARFRSGRHARDLFSPGIRVHRARFPRRSRHERRASSASECRASRAGKYVIYARSNEQWGPSFAVRSVPAPCSRGCSRSSRSTRSITHHRPTLPDVTGPSARFPIFLSTPPEHAHRFTAIRAFPGQGGPSGTVRPAPPIRGHKRERAKRPPRRPTRADSATLPVNEKTRLDFEAGLNFRVYSRFAAPLAGCRVDFPRDHARSSSSVWSFNRIRCQRFRTVAAWRPVAVATLSHGTFSFRIRTISRSTGSSVPRTAASRLRNSSSTPLGALNDPDPGVWPQPSTWRASSGICCPTRSRRRAFRMKSKVTYRANLTASRRMSSRVTACGYCRRNTRRSCIVVEAMSLVCSSLVRRPFLQARMCG